MLITCLARVVFLVGLLLVSSGCATVPNGSESLKSSAPRVPLPSSTRVLGQATVYISSAGGRLEVAHDALAGIIIVKLPEGGTAVLSEEIAGSEGRYRDNRMTVWENDGVALLWIDGKLVFSGRVTH